MIELFREQTGDRGGSVTVAEVGAVDENGVTLVLPGQTEASQKKYKRLASAADLAAEDLVLIARVSGSYVVLGKITS